MLAKCVRLVASYFAWDLTTIWVSADGCKKRILSLLANKKKNFCHELFMFDKRRENCFVTMKTDTRRKQTKFVNKETLEHWESETKICFTLPSLTLTHIETQRSLPRWCNQDDSGKTLIPMKWDYVMSPSSSLERKKKVSFLLHNPSYNEFSSGCRLPDLIEFLAQQKRNRFPSPLQSKVLETGEQKIRKNSIYLPTMTKKKETFDLKSNHDLCTWKVNKEVKSISINRFLTISDGIALHRFKLKRQFFVNFRLKRQTH